MSTLITGRSVSVSFHDFVTNGIEKVSVSRRWLALGFRAGNGASARNRAWRVWVAFSVMLMVGVASFSGVAYGNEIHVATFTQDQWTPGANPFQTPINPYQIWSFNLNSLAALYPHIEILSASLRINAWDFDTANSAVNTMVGNATSGYVYNTYYDNDYNSLTHTGTLFDPTSLNDIVNVEGNGSHVMSYWNGGLDSGLLLDLAPDGPVPFSYLLDGSLDCSLDFNEVANWQTTIWSITHPIPGGGPGTVTDWHYDHVASGQPGTFGLGAATLTVEYVVPEPATLTLLGLGLVGLMYRRYRHARS